MVSILKEDDATVNYETEVLNYIHSNHPSLIDRFNENLVVSRKTILHQLVQAILREKILPVEWKNEAAVISVNEAGYIKIPIAKRYTLGHIDLGGDVQFIEAAGEKHVITDADQLLSILDGNGAFPASDNLEQFFLEVANSTQNYGLALTAADQRMKAVQVQASQWGKSDSFSYALENQRLDTTFSPLTFFEQWVIQGHTIHPCSRTRLGLSPQDVMNYAPEWGGQPAVIPVAVHKDYCHLTNREDHSATQILLDEYPELKNEFTRTLSEEGLAASDYELIPVHPWQYENTIKQYYKELLENRSIIPMTSTINTAALVSFRSLAPLGDQTKHHIKTAVNVQMTSAVRTVSAASTRNGPVISSVLKKIAERDSFISNTLSFMGEDAGIHFEPEASVGADERYFLQKNLASIIRENPEASLKEGEIAIPAAALIAKSPVSGNVILEELVLKYKESAGLASVQEAAEKFIKRYVEVLLPGVMGLMIKYGISLEAHLQNCVCVFKEGMPERVILRDNGGIRIMTERINQFMTVEELDNSTNLLTDQQQELHDIFFHAIIHNHLGEMNVALSRRLDLDEKKLWKPVRDMVEKVYGELHQDPEVLARDKALLSSPQSSMKALVKMRLTNKFTENAYVDIVNPLYDEVHS